MRAERGLLEPAESRRRYLLERREPSADLADHVLHHWLVTWDVAEPYKAAVLPFAAVNLTVETRRGAVVTGVSTGRYTYEVAGRGRVVGCRFRAGGVRPLLTGPVADLTDRERPAREVLGDDVGDRLEALVDAPVAEAVGGVEDVLRRWLPVDDPEARRVAVLVEEVAVRPEVVRVEQLAEVAGLGVRSLQRLFREYVGVPPKWVLTRERLHDVAEALGRGEPLDLAALAARLGYVDQAHLSRDVRAVVGVPPGEYLRRCAAATAGA